MKRLWFLIFFKASFASGATLVAVENQETVVAVNSDVGTIIDLPSAVKTVTPAKFFLLQDIAGQAGAKADVRTFLIKPTAHGATEVVTFVLANGQALALKLVPVQSGEKYYSLVFEPKRRGQTHKFLAAEMAMMRAMLLDEGGGFAREAFGPHDKSGRVDVEFDGLEFRLLRLYAAADQTGYVFLVTNRGPESKKLNLSSLAFARPNRALLAQVDKTELAVCPTLSTAEECQTALRMVIKGPKPPEPLLTSFGPSAPPFAEKANLGGPL